MNTLPRPATSGHYSRIGSFHSKTVQLSINKLIQKFTYESNEDTEGTEVTKVPTVLNFVRSEEGTNGDK